MADHIPDPGKHRTLFYSYYANRVRGHRAEEEPGEGKVEKQPAEKRRCSAISPPAFSDTEHGWQVAASESGTCARGSRICSAEPRDVHQLSFGSAGALEFVNEHS